MKQIRQSVFETNSSSTHSICIAKNATLELPKEIHFSLGEFGWKCDTLGTLRSKASYLYTGLENNKRLDDFNKITALLTSKGIAVTAEPAVEGNWSYVDHADELNEFLDAVCSDEDKLMSYLFSPLSFIITGNDNDDQDVEINVTYDHDKYYKGN